MCIFLPQIYVKYEVITPSVTEAPRHDFELIKELLKFKWIDKDMKEVYIKKFGNHLGYLTPQNAVLAFFDGDIPASVNQRKAVAINSEEQDEFSIKKFHMPASVQA